MEWFINSTDLECYLDIKDRERPRIYCEYPAPRSIDKMISEEKEGTLIANGSKCHIWAEFLDKDGRVIAKAEIPKEAGFYARAPAWQYSGIEIKSNDYCQKNRR